MLIWIIGQCKIMNMKIVEESVDGGTLMTKMLKRVIGCGIMPTKAKMCHICLKKRKKTYSHEELDLCEKCHKSVEEHLKLEIRHKPEKI
jgi:hypothetical protein